MTARRRASRADRRLLPEGRLAGPMPWVIAIMMFLTVLAAAGGIGLASAGARFTTALSSRLSIAIVEPDPDRREAEARAAAAVLRTSGGVRDVRRLGQAEVERLLAPWLGGDLGGIDVPVPALLDVDLSGAARARLPAIAAAIRRAAPAARIDDHAGWLGPLGRLIHTLVWLAGALVALMGAATAAVVALAARGSLDTHRATIDVLHLMGGTDPQIARLFQRRLALDALFGGLIGWAVSAAGLLLLAHQFAAAGTGLLGAVTVPPLGWLALAALPAGAALIAFGAARLTVVRALKRLP